MDRVREANERLNRRMEAIFGDEVTEGVSVEMRSLRALYVGLPFDAEEAAVYVHAAMQDVRNKLADSDFEPVLQGAINMALLVGALVQEEG